MKITDFVSMAVNNSTRSYGGDNRQRKPKHGQKQWNGQRRPNDQYQKLGTLGRQEKPHEQQRPRHPHNPQTQKHPQAQQRQQQGIQMAQPTESQKIQLLKTHLN